MTAEASWGDAGSPTIDWRMSAALENVPRGDGDLAEVTNLAEAIRSWAALDPPHRLAATLTPERPLMIDGVAHDRFDGDAIAQLAHLMPEEVSDDTLPDDGGQAA